MKKLFILLMGLSILCLSACGTNYYGYDDALLSDEELEDRVLYLMDLYVLPVFWWTGAGTQLLNVNEFVEPLADTPKDTAFFPVWRFNSIAEMKRATEQVMTKKYAQEHLYPFLEENRQFLERDGRLYINTNGGCGAAPFEPASATVVSKTKDRAVLNVVFRDPFDYEETHEIELQKENDIWKLNNFPYLS